MKKLKKILEKYYLRQIVICWVMWSMLLALTPVNFAMADTTPLPDAVPGSGDLTSAIGAGITGEAANWLQVTQTQNEAIMNWTNFDIGSKSTVDFLQPSARAAIFNRVSDASGTGIWGTINANGRVFIINPAGIVFGCGAHINVTQLVASNLKLDDADFLNGAPYNFYDGHEATGEVVFNAHWYNVHGPGGVGEIERLYLIGKHIWNKGGLVAKDFVVMAAGDSVLVSEPDSSVVVEVSMGGFDPSQFKVENKDTPWPWDWVETKLEADHVILAAGDLWSQAICNVKTVEIDVAGPIEKGDLDSIDAYSGPSSDAVARVSITSGSSIAIDDDITATANGEGVADNAIATIDISAGEDVEITNGQWWCVGTDTEVRATAKDGRNNTANVDITADGDVDILACSADAKVKAEAYGYCYEALSNQANVDVTAGGDVHINSEGGQLRTWWTGCGRHRTKHSSFTPYVASVEAIAENALNSNTATVDITAGGDIVVLSKDGGEAKVLSYAGNALDSQNTANINLTAEDGYVLVHGIGGEYSTCEGFTPSEASVEATAEYAGIKDSDGTNSANITIVAKDIVEEIPITVASVEGGVEEECFGDGDVGVIGVNGGKAEIEAKAMHGYDNTSRVDITADDDVQVIADCFEQPSQAEIMALAKHGTTNTADVLICVDGGVKVKGESGGEAEIEALAKDGFTNTASVGIGAKGEEGVKVIANDDGEAEISSKAINGYTNTASTIVCTKGGIDVKATCGGDAGILSQAIDGIVTNAYVGVCAVGKVVVKACHCCESLIRAEAESETYANDVQLQQLPIDGLIETSADAETVVVSHQGNVEVLAYNHGHSGIEAEAQGAHKNTAKVGVAAGADLSPSDVFVPASVIPSGEVITAGIYEGPYYSTGNVIVEASCGSEAQILAYAHDAVPIYGGLTSLDREGIPGENTADVVICAPGEVVVEADRCSEARIKSRAGDWREDGSINQATTQVYASEVKVDVPGHRGNGILAKAGSDHVSYCIEDGYIVKEEGGAKLIVGTYADRKDCPDCPPCPCEKEAPTFAPVAPLPPYHIPRIEGCPELTQAAAAELGIPEETLQVGMGNALALNPNIQPCQACEALVNAASILKDEDGRRMAAMVQAFNTLAPADVPYTPEMATSIAMAFENAAEGTQYASAMEFIDAFVQYAIALDELGSPVGDSMSFVMNKYGAGITGSDNANMAAFVTARIESGRAL